MTRLASIIRRLATKVIENRDGAVSVIAAVSFTTMVGFVGLGTEASYWYVKKRAVQGAVDSASFSAVAAMMNGETWVSGSPGAAAQAIAAQYGFTNGVGGVSVAVNNPPSSGPNAANNLAVEVIISQPQPRLFSSLFISTSPTVRARAVALQTVSGGNGCILALDRGKVEDVVDTGNSTVNIPNCSMYINSNDPNCALFMSGSSVINAYSTYIVGDKCISGGAKLNDSNGTFTRTSNPISDPYADRQVNMPSQCDAGTSGGALGSGYAVNGSASGTTVTLSPGVYCGGIQANATGGTNATLNLNPGVYYMNGGQFKANGNITVNGAGVTIVLTGSGSNYATVQVNGSAQLNISAPTTGATAGMAFFQDQTAPPYTGTNATPDATHTNTFNGNATQNITGAIYFPNQLTVFTGNAGTGANGSQCTQLISFAIKISGNTTFNSNCANTGVASIGGTATANLVE